MNFQEQHWELKWVMETKCVYMLEALLKRESGGSMKITFKNL